MYESAVYANFEDRLYICQGSENVKMPRDLLTVRLIRTEVPLKLFSI